tara:strand:+ start:689 stop:868 length:180 start_codon:yes stop_codon:yes gene_type:complete
MKKETIIWLFLSSFGIMFAVFSWIQETFNFSEVYLEGYKKGVYALFFGIILYKILAKKA